MCEIFPEVDKCCICCSIRVGMLFICILSIGTGVLMMSAVVRKTNVNVDSAVNASSIPDKYKNITIDPNDFKKGDLAKIGKGVKDAVKLTVAQVPGMIPLVITGMAFIFMISGGLLLFANLSDQEGFVQVFVWTIFLNIVLGLILVIVIGVECMVSSEKCFLKGMDWLSAAGSLTMFAGYMFLWVYFISVSNSYVLQLYAR